MNRSEFQELSRIRLIEAKALLDGGLYDGAYYLAGYAVECALKACIARQTREHDFPPDRRALDDIYTHDFTRLVRAAGLADELERHGREDPEFFRRWSRAKDWREDSRYQRKSRTEAESIYNDIADLDHGVLTWLHRHF